MRTPPPESRLGRYLLSEPQARKQSLHLWSPPDTLGKAPKARYTEIISNGNGSIIFCLTRADGKCAWSLLFSFRLMQNIYFSIDIHFLPAPPTVLPGCDGWLCRYLARSDAVSYGETPDRPAKARVNTFNSHLNF